MIKIINSLLLNFFIFIIKIYQLFFSNLLNSQCRYLPSCSEYTILALKTHGIFKGWFLSIKRIMSCHPFGGAGYDPIHIKKKK